MGKTVGSGVGVDAIVDAIAGVGVGARTIGSGSSQATAARETMSANTTGTMHRKRHRLP